MSARRCFTVCHMPDTRCSTDASQFEWLQEDELYIPFCTYGCYQRIPFCFQNSSQIFFLTSRVCNLTETFYMSSVLVSCNVSKLLSWPTWPDSRLSCCVACLFSLNCSSENRFHPTNTGLRCAFWIPSCWVVILLIPLNGNTCTLNLNKFSERNLQFGRSIFFFFFLSSLNSLTCPLFHLLYLCHMFKSIGLGASGRDSPALVPSVHCEIVVLFFFFTLILLISLSY